MVKCKVEFVGYDIDEPTYGKCQEAAEEMVTYLKKNKKNGTIITLMCRLGACDKTARKR